MQCAPGNDNSWRGRYSSHVFSGFCKCVKLCDLKIHFLYFVSNKKLSKHSHVLWSGEGGTAEGKIQR